jgi:hypothetical protein
MKTQETLNTKLIDVFHYFPAIICVPCFDKPSNSYDHCKMEPGATFSRILKIGSGFEHGRNLVRAQNLSRSCTPGTVGHRLRSNNLD